MATAMRMIRTGSHKRPEYRLVVIHKERANKGGVIEYLGYYLLRREPEEFKLNDERVLYWLTVGAEPTATAKSLLKKAGIWAKHIVAKAAHKKKAA